MKQNYQIEINTIYFPLHPETPQEGRSLQELFGPTANIEAVIQRLKQLMDIEGLPFNVDRHMTYNSRLAQELAKWGERSPQSEQLNMALYQAYFVDGQNIGDIDLLVHIVEQVGLDGDEARNVLEQRKMQATVDQDWQHARSVGVSSVPTFAIGMTGVVGAQPYEQLVHLMEHVGAEKRGG